MSISHRLEILPEFGYAVSSLRNLDCSSRLRIKCANFLTTDLYDATSVVAGSLKTRAKLKMNSFRGYCGDVKQIGYDSTSVGGVLGVKGGGDRDIRFPQSD